MSAIALTFLSAFIGLLLTIIYEGLKGAFVSRHELRENQHIQLKGNRWYAAWQTSVNGVENINTEQLELKQKGRHVTILNLAKSKENPLGGYLWKARTQFYQGRYLMGWYLPIKSENITSKGIMFCTYQSQRRIFYGKWVGCSFDGDLAAGFFVISSSREQSLAELNKILEKHREPVTIISNAL